MPKTTRMQPALKFILFVCPLMFTSLTVYSQVQNIKKSVQNDKNTSYTYSSSRTSYSSQNSYTDRTSFKESLTNDIFSGIFYGLTFISVKAQKSVLSNKESHPNLVSLQADLDYGTNFSELTFNPSFRANWGLLATDFRYALLHDNTGSLESLDWQVLILRIPIKNIKLNYGIGFTSLMSPKSTYFESSTGFDLNLYQRRINLSGNYRWTSRKMDYRYRQEVKFIGDYLIMQKNRFSLSPMIGITYQEYFKQDNYLLFNVGVRIRLSWE